MASPDTQNDFPESALKLTEVGIKNLKILMTIKRNGTIFITKRRPLYGMSTRPFIKKLWIKRTETAGSGGKRITI